MRVLLSILVMSLLLSCASRQAKPFAGEAQVNTSIDAPETIIINNFEYERKGKVEWPKIAATQDDWLLNVFNIVFARNDDGYFEVGSVLHINGRAYVEIEKIEAE